MVNNRCSIRMFAAMTICGFLLVSCGDAPEPDRAADGPDHPASEVVLRPTGPDAIGYITTVSDRALGAPTEVDYGLVEVSAPTFAWKDATGAISSVEDYRGSVILVNFWGTWCPPCIRELPELVEIRNEFGPRGFEILGVALERPQPNVDPATHLASFAEARGLEYPMILGDERVTSSWGGIRAVPTSYLVDRNGRIVAVVEGAVTADQLRAMIEPVL